MNNAVCIFRRLNEGPSLERDKSYGEGPKNGKFFVKSFYADLELSNGALFPIRKFKVLGLMFSYFCELSGPCELSVQRCRILGKAT